MIMLILKSLYFFLPAYFANMTPVFAAKLFPKWDYPLDFYLKIESKRMLGDHKTIRGLVFGIAASVLICLIQYLLYTKYDAFRAFSLINYDLTTALSLGYLLGCGALFGDALKSFIKRRIDVQPGKPWMPFDQIDFSISGLLFAISYVPSAGVATIILLSSPILSVLSTKMGFYIKLRNEQW
ncbi:CDP-archaeol synthase [Candidatus Woesearchaeota archaeon]|nr:CDP-archaeol synthase [Candidatus Woesearchaeota archaeon]